MQFAKIDQEFTKIYLCVLFKLFPFRQGSSAVIPEAHKRLEVLKTNTRSEDHKPDHSEQSFEKMFLLLLLESFSPVPVVLLHLRIINSLSPKLEYCMSKIYLVLECFKIFLRAFCILSAEWKCVQNFAQLSDKSGSKLTFSGNI